MLRSMYSAISALRGHQTYMDVIGNNIANVNTAGYKAGRMTFQDVLSQTVRGSTSPTSNRAGMNPAQVGLGAQMGTIDIIQSQGDIMSTNKPTDMAIQGDGFFVLNEGMRYLYTRDGAFDVSSDGYLVSPSTGLRVQGWSPTIDAVTGNNIINTSEPIGDIKIPLQSMVSGKATDKLQLSGNLDARAVAAAVDATLSSTMVVYDSVGAPHNISIKYTKTSPSQWTLAVSSTDTNIGAPALASTTITFDATGKVLTPAADVNLTFNFLNGYPSANQTVALDFTELTHLASQSEVNQGTQDGYGPGSLLSFEVSQNGEITGIYSNGVTSSLGQISVARIPNPGGLSRQGSNAYAVSNNSGTPLIGAASTGGRGSVVSGSLEMSNVDLAQEFTNMISAQRGFQANSRIITTSDEMLQELISLKR